MTLSRPRLTAAALFAVGVAEVAIVIGCGFASELGWMELNNLLVFSNAAIGLSLSTAGWPIAARCPRNPIGWLLLAGGISYASTAAGITALACVPVDDRADPGWRLVATLTNTGWTWALSLFLPVALMLFPDGRLPSRRWRPLLVLPAVGAPILGALGVMSDFSRSVGVSGYGAAPAAQHSLPGAVATVVMTVAITLSYVGALACLLVRFRHGTEQVRRQLLWVLLALLLVVTTFVLDPLLPDSTFILLTIALIPVAISVAVLRHQLLDIRVVFSRSLLYLLLTGAVIGVYLLVVALLDQVVRSQVALGTSVLATLIVVVAFNPLRVWVQRLVNRAVYGAREDPVRAMAAVGTRLSKVGDQPGAGLAEVLASLCRVMRFPYGSISVQGHELATVGHTNAPEVSSVHVTELGWGEESLGQLVIGLRPGERKLASADRQILDLLADPITLAVRAGLLSTELSRSREQVITAREEERRRLRRDLHDGLGPVLTGVVLNAEAALRLIESDPQRSAELVGRLRDQTSGALSDIRRLVYNLRPPALDSLGLVGALEEYARLLTRRADGEPLAVTVRATGALPPLPAAVEVAAYRIVAEALTNITRHSSATSARVSVAADDSALTVGVHDDGVNLSSGWQPGVGLTSIRERAAELGGQCTITTDRSGGRIDVRLPIPAILEPGRPSPAARTTQVAR